MVNGANQRFHEALDEIEVEIVGLKKFSPGYERIILSLALFISMPTYSSHH